MTKNQLLRQLFRFKIKKNKLPPIQVVCVECGDILAELYGVRIGIAEYECLNCEHKTQIGVRTNL